MTTQRTSAVENKIPTAVPIAKSTATINGEVIVELILLDRNPFVVAEWKKQKVFTEDPRVKIICANLQDVDRELHKLDSCNLDKVSTYDCLINSGNSFGQMDGGSDTIICEMFGWSLLTRVQESILKYWGGEQPVGTSLLVPLAINATNTDRILSIDDGVNGSDSYNSYCGKWLVHTPLTRSPAQKFDEKMNSSYLALWGALMTIENAKEDLFMAVDNRNHNNCTGVSNVSNLSVGRKIRVLCLGLGTGMAGGNAKIIAKQMALAWENYRNRVSLKEAKEVQVLKESKFLTNEYLIPSVVVDLKTRELFETTKPIKPVATSPAATTTLAAVANLSQSRSSIPLIGSTASIGHPSYFTFSPLASAKNSHFLST